MKTIHDILTLIVLTLFVSGMSSCRQNDEPEPAPVTGKTKIEMTLTVSDTSAGSRAPSTPEGGYHSGEAFENYIDLPSLNFRFYFFDKDNKFVAPLEVGHVIPVESTSSSKTYKVTSFAMTEAMTGEIKLVVLANWPTYPDLTNLEAGVTTIDDIVNQQYDFDASKMELTADNPIPLYGVTDLMTLNYDSGNTAHIGNIHLLRAYAKVEINLNSGCVFPIEWVRLSRYNKRGYCAPGGIYSQSDYVYNDYDKDYTKEPSVPTGVEVAEELPFIKVSDTRWIAYVPEYRNIGRSDEEKAVIKVRFKGADTEVDNIYFAHYDTTTSPSKPSSHFDVLRNVWYKFTVDKLSPPLVQIVPYNEVDLGPIFGLLIGKDFVPIYNDNGTIRYYYDPNTGKYYGPDGKNEIEDPYVSVLQPEGWVIVRDLNDYVIGYYDPQDGQYYDADKHPVHDLDIDVTTGWAVIRDKDGNVLRYYDSKTHRYIANDRVTEVEPDNGWHVIRNSETDEILGYYDPEAKKYYDTDKQTEKPSLGEGR